MTSIQNSSTSLLLALALALLAGCSSSGPGSAQLAVSVPQALNSSISRVSVTASAADMPSVSLDLVSTHGVWGGFLGSIPAGANRSFLAQAFDASNALLFEGSTSGVSIAPDQTALVAITLRQINAPPPFQNAAPVIDSLVASSTSLPAGGALALVATARDPNPGDTLSYAWSSTAGSFSSAASASTSWTAPASPGVQTLTFTVTDSQGLSSSVSLAVYVASSLPQGAARFSISFNTTPQVASLIASPTRLAVGQSTAVSVSASDVDGDSLSYSWSASCAGSWANATSASARFTPSVLPFGACNNCRLTASVSDGRGGQTTGTVALCVSNAPIINHLHPVIVSSSHSADTAVPTQVLTYEVVASDPEGSALSFSWADNAGALGTPATGASSSRITWTAPSCVRASAPPTITATVTNAFNLTATQSFSVTGLPLCPPPSWASTGSMLSARSAFMATLLLNGKVLVAESPGDSFMRVELYDPASGTWSATGSMDRQNCGPYPFAQALLPDGKVLASGGYCQTEGLYDPALGTWGTTGAMLSPRLAHTATPLLNGKVLVAGGVNFESQDTNYLGTAELYDPVSNTWSATGQMTWRRHNHTATLLADGRVLVLGGYSSRGELGADAYDPATGTWSAAGSMVSPRSGCTATRLTNGQVLIAGGYNYTSSYLASAEVYDPASNTFSPVGSMASPRQGHAATLLPDGRVLVSGGYDVNGKLATAEEYDPVSGTWSTVTTMGSPRSGHRATRLPNGKVLIVGGNSGSPVTAELYTP